MRRWVETLKNWRFLPLALSLLLAACIATAGFVLVQQSARRLLETEARNESQLWANHLSKRIAELPQIAEGKQPSVSTLQLLNEARGIGRVYSFRVYDANGLLKLRSDDFTRTLGRNQPIAKIDSEFAEAIKTGKPLSIAHTGNAIGEPPYFAASLLPIENDSKTVGWLVTRIDQSDRQALVVSMATRISLTVGFLLAVVPLFGLWYRSHQRKIISRKLENLEHFDRLTGLPQKSYFLKQISEQFSGLTDDNSQCALIVCELSDLKTVDANFGRQAVEHILELKSRELAVLTPKKGQLAFLDSGRFALFIPKVTDPLAVLSLAKEVTARFSQPVEWHAQRLTIQGHAGIGLSSSDGKDAETLMRNAELALRSAQEQGTPGYGFFNPEIAQDMRRRIAIQRAVVEAVDKQSFRLDFQPVYNIRTGDLNGFEALIRLHDEQLGAVSPAEFIPVAEQSGLINQIGAWCLEEACRVASSWPSHLTVSVNLSPAQFYSGSLIADIHRALESNQLPSYRLEVEITEGTLLKDSELVLEQLRVLREKGVAIALDDFGTGYSSLSYLWKFPFSKLKIDRSFINALDESQSARGILRSIVKLGHGLGLSVTAEGIENIRQFNTLRDLGCDLAQGFLLDRPARVADLAGIILRNFAQGLSRSARDISDHDTSNKIAGAA